MGSSTWIQEYLTGTEKGWEPQLMVLPYDVEGCLKAFTESGLDDLGMTLNKAVKKSIVTGINYFYRYILAMEKAAKEAGVPLFRICLKKNGGSWKKGSGYESVQAGSYAKECPPQLNARPDRRSG